MGLQKEKQKLKDRQKADRLESFCNSWPGNIPDSNKKPDIEVLAEAGFYFIGLSDVVKCLSCELSLGSWEEEDDPWIKHCQNSPSCSFLLDSKGPEWVYDNYKAEE